MPKADINLIAATTPNLRSARSAGLRSGTEFSKGFDASAAKFKNLPLGKITSDIGDFENALGASTARVLAFGASASVFAGVITGFKNTIASVVQVEKALQDINVVFELTQSNLNKFSGGLFNVAKATGQSFSVVAEAATEFARQGLSTEETLKRVRDSLILTRLSGLDAAKSVQSLTAAVNGFKGEALDTTQVVNRLANVDAAFAVSSADLAESLARSGAAAQSAKVSFNELISITTAVQQITARGGSVIGNSFKTIFTRLQRSGVQEALEEVGVVTKNAAGEFRSATAILEDYARIYNTLDDAAKAYTAEQVAGVRQVNNLKALISDLNSEYSIYRNALSTANNTTDEAIRRNEALNDTLAATINRTKETGRQFSQLFGGNLFGSGFKNVLTVVNSLGESLNNLFGAGKENSELGFLNKLFQGIASGIGSFLAGPGLALGLKTALRLMRFLGSEALQALDSIRTISIAGAKVAETERAILDQLSRNSQYRQDIIAASGNQVEIEKTLYKAYDQQTKELQDELNLKKEVLKISKQIVAAGGGKYVADSRIKGRNSNRVVGAAPSSRGLADAIRTEKALGGNPAIGYVKGVGTVVYDRNTQRSAQDAIRDHGGIRGALRDSAAAQAFVTGNRVPNFAPLKSTELGKSLKLNTGKSFLFESFLKSVKSGQTSIEQLNSGIKFWTEEIKKARGSTTSLNVLINSAIKSSKKEVLVSEELTRRKEKVERNESEDRQRLLKTKSGRKILARKALADEIRPSIRIGKASSLDLKINERAKIKNEDLQVQRAKAEAERSKRLIQQRKFIRDPKEIRERFNRRYGTGFKNRLSKIPGLKGGARFLKGGDGLGAFFAAQSAAGALENFAQNSESALIKSGAGGLSKGLQAGFSANVFGLKAPAALGLGVGVGAGSALLDFFDKSDDFARKIKDLGSEFTVTKNTATQAKDVASQLNQAYKDGDSSKVAELSEKFQELTGQIQDKDLRDSFSKFSFSLGSGIDDLDTALRKAEKQFTERIKGLEAAASVEFLTGSTRTASTIKSGLSDPITFLFDNKKFRGDLNKRQEDNRKIISKLLLDTANTGQDDIDVNKLSEETNPQIYLKEYLDAQAKNVDSFKNNIREIQLQLQNTSLEIPGQLDLIKDSLVNAGFDQNAINILFENSEKNKEEINRILDDVISSAEVNLKSVTGAVTQQRSRLLQEQKKLEKSIQSSGQGIKEYLEKTRDIFDFTSKLLRESVQEILQQRVGTSLTSSFLQRQNFGQQAFQLRKSGGLERASIFQEIFGLKEFSSLSSESQASIKNLASTGNISEALLKISQISKSNSEFGEKAKEISDRIAESNLEEKKQLLVLNTQLRTQEKLLAAQNVNRIQNAGGQISSLFQSLGLPEDGRIFQAFSERQDRRSSIRQLAELSGDTESANLLRSIAGRSEGLDVIRQLLRTQGFQVNSLDANQIFRGSSGFLDRNKDRFNFVRGKFASGEQVSREELRFLNRFSVAEQARDFTKSQLNQTRIDAKAVERSRLRGESFEQSQLSIQTIRSLGEQINDAFRESGRDKGTFVAGLDQRLARQAFERDDQGRIRFKKDADITGNTDTFRKILSQILDDSTKTPLETAFSQFSKDFNLIINSLPEKIKNGLNESVSKQKEMSDNISAMTEQLENMTEVLSKIAVKNQSVPSKTTNPEGNPGKPAPAPLSVPSQSPDAMLAGQRG